MTPEEWLTKLAQGHLSGDTETQVRHALASYFDQQAAQTSDHQTAASLRLKAAEQRHWAKGPSMGI